MVYFCQATLRFDGSCSPNPGKGGSGYLMLDDCADEAFRGQYYVGESATNNVAEYFGLIAGLKHLRGSGIKVGDLVIEGDSELVINQLKGQYKARAPRMKTLNRIARQLIDRRKGRDFDTVSFRHIDRRFNEEADRLARDARVEKVSWSRDNEIDY